MKMGNLGLELQIGVCVVVAVVRWKRAAKVCVVRTQQTVSLPHDHFEGSLKKRTKRKTTYCEKKTKN